MDHWHDAWREEKDLYWRGLVTLGLAVTLGLITGCAPPRVDAVPHAAPAWQQGIVRSQPPLASWDTSVVIAPQENSLPTLTLPQALALLQNPELRAFAWEVRAAEARTLQAGLRPNPELGLEVENVVGTGTFQDGRRTETTLRLSQVIELGGKRARRLRVAALAHDLAAWDYETKRLDVLTAVAQAFIEVVRAQERLKTQDELVQVAAQIRTTVAARVQAGKVSPVEETKVGVALASSRAARERARRELDGARTRLAATWGESRPAFQRVEGAFETLSTPPSLEALSERIVQNPDLARWHTEMQQRQATLDLARAQKRPDVTAGGGIRHVNEAHAATLVLSFSMPLPVFHRNQGAILEAQYQLAKVEEERRAAVIQVRTALATAYATLTAAFAEATTLREAIVPAARQVLAATREGYRQGKFALLDVLDAQRTLFEAQGQYIEAVATYHKAVAEVERVIGGELSPVTGTAVPPNHGAQP